MKAQQVLQKTPCLWQIRVCQELLCRKSVILISPTGSGKTLTFLLPFLFEKEGITILVSPLNLLGEQLSNALELEKLGVQAIQLTKEGASPTTIKVRSHLIF